MNKVIQSAKSKLNSAVEALVEAEEERLREKDAKERERERRRSKSYDLTQLTEPPSSPVSRDATVEKEHNSYGDYEDQGTRGRPRSKSVSTGSESSNSEPAIIKRFGRIAWLSPKGVRELEAKEKVKGREPRHHDREDLRDSRERLQGQNFRAQEEDQEDSKNSQPNMFPSKGKGKDDDKKSPSKRRWSFSRNKASPRSSKDGLLKEDVKIPSVPKIPQKWKDGSGNGKASGPVKRVPKEAGSTPIRSAARDKPSPERPARSDEAQERGRKERRERDEKQKKKPDEESKRRKEAAHVEARKRRERERKDKDNVEQEKRDVTQKEIRARRDRLQAALSPPTSQKKYRDDEVAKPPERSKSKKLVKSLEPTPEPQPKRRDSYPYLQPPQKAADLGEDANEPDSSTSLNRGCGDMTRTFIYGMVTKEEKEANDRKRAEIKKKYEEEQLALRKKLEEEERQNRMKQEEEERLNAQTVALNANAGIGDNMRTYVYGMVSKEEKEANDRARRELQRNPIGRYRG